MALVHVEIPDGVNQTILLEVEDADLDGVPDEADLMIEAGDLPGIAGAKIIVVTAAGTGSPVHVERPAAGGVLLQVPADAGLPVADEDDLTILAGIPGTTLVLLSLPAA